MDTITEKMNIRGIEKKVFWFDISHRNYDDKVENLVAKWYDILKYAAKS